MCKRSCKILIAATGSVAALKIPILLKSLLDLSAAGNTYSFDIHLLVTENAKHFFKISSLPKKVQLYDDNLEWSSWHQKGDPVWHVKLSNLADMTVIAPLNANTMSKIANGICDNLLTCTIRAWDLKKPLVFCPSMNVRMWEHPITEKHVKILKQWGFIEVPPIYKQMICGSVGTGALADVQDILDVILKVVDCRICNSV